jgi:cysteinyl-tRNA synthetase
MSCEMLGESFDIHGGGADLQFPHHENEIAQSEGASGQPLARFWMHNGFVRVDNEKMSKSLGNFFTIREVLARYDAETVRFFILRAHYRSALNYSDAHLDDARNALKRLYTALASGQSMLAAFGLSAESLPISELPRDDSLVDLFIDQMNDDFNTPGAVSSLFVLASDVNILRNSLAHHESLKPELFGHQKDSLFRKVQALKSLGAVLGILQEDPTAFLQGGSAASGLDEAAIQQQIEARAAAKAAKDWPEADRIRKTLLEQGVVLKDSPAGTSWERT